MNSEERDIIARFVQRVAGAPSGGSVPATGGQPLPPLPPLDPEADQHLSTLFGQYPEARYRMTQFAFAQEHALEAAGQRIQQLEQQMQARQPVQPGQMQGQGQGQPSGFFSRLFGGPPQGQSQGAPYAQPYQGQQGFGGPPPGYPPQQGYPQQGYAQQGGPGFGGGLGGMRGGSGFLGSALTTAAGVAGGVMAANALEGLFSGREGELRRSGWRRRQHDDHRGSAPGRHARSGLGQRPGRLEPGRWPRPRCGSERLDHPGRQRRLRSDADQTQPESRSR